MVSKRSIFTVVTPLPSTITRESAVEALHDHARMIELNPLVISHDQCKPPPNAPADEFHCVWYQLTDRISYLPGIKGQVSYKACFHDLPRGVQTHVYAPAGLEIKEKWSIGGNEPGEEREVMELGSSNLGVPREGLYLREDVDMRCNVFLGSFVKKTLNKAHGVLVQRLVVKADLVDDKKVRDSYARSSIMTGASSIRIASPRSSGMYDRSPSSGNFSMSSFTESRPASTIPEDSVMEMQNDKRWIAELPANTPSKLDEGMRPQYLAPPVVELP